MTTIRFIAAAIAAATLLSACGVSPTSSATAARNAAMTAQKAKAPTGPSQGMGSLFTVIQNAGTWVFNSVDMNKDNVLSEAEAQTKGLADAAFAATDFNHDASVTREEFDRWYATKVGPNSAAAIRTHLAEDFVKLDTNKDGFVSATEAGIATPAKLLGHPIGLAVAGTQLVDCGGFDGADFKAADETKDGVLVRSEFEDLWSLSIKRRLGVTSK